MKSKLGLSAYVTITVECLVGGPDTTKDDENMNSQPFNRWRDRFLHGMDAVKRAEAESREAKGHFFNVTASSTGEALWRPEHIALQGNPLGSTRNRVAIEVNASGNSLDDAARTCPEVREATELWDRIRFEVEIEKWCESRLHQSPHQVLNRIEVFP